ncbi:L-lactate permease, partial [Escherichia coli]
GKMISPQSIAIACAAVGLVGKESDLFRFTVKHSLIFIESFHGGVNKTKVRHHCFTRPVGITSKNGVNDSLMLFGQL